MQAMQVQVGGTQPPSLPLHLAHDVAAWHQQHWPYQDPHAGHACAGGGQCLLRMEQSRHGGFHAPQNLLQGEEEETRV